MFFVILFSNLMGTLLDFVGIAFPGLEEWIIAPTTDAVSSSDSLPSDETLVSWEVFLWICSSFLKKYYYYRKGHDAKTRILSAVAVY